MSASAFPALRNDTFLRALLRQPTDYTPIWLMRQAGRYLPEYNATRAKAGSFLKLAKTPDYATEVTLQPLERFPLDAAILFSDILTVPDAMGLGLDFVAGEGPRFLRPLRDEADIARLQAPDLGSLHYVFEAVTQIRHALNGRVPLIGFAGSPWTLACYMIEGAGSADFSLTRRMLYRRPDLMHHLLGITADAVTAYLNAQIAAGAQAVMVFDTWGGLLADGFYQTFSLAYMRRIVANLTHGRDAADPNTRVPSIVFTKGGGLWLKDLAACGCDAVGLDWTVSLQEARALVGEQVALQGNLDPLVLLSDEKAVRAQAIRVLDSFGPPSAGTGHVFNLGHGISQHTPPEHVAALTETVHAHSRLLRRG